MDWPYTRRTVGFLLLVRLACCTNSACANETEPTGSDAILAAFRQIQASTPESVSANGHPSTSATPGDSNEGDVQDSPSPRTVGATNRVSKSTQVRRLEPAEQDDLPAPTAVASKPWYEQDTPSQITPAHSPEKIDFAQVVSQLVFATFGVMILCGGTLLLAKRWLKSNVPNKQAVSELAVVESLQVNGKVQLRLVRVGQHKVLLGMDAHGLQHMEVLSSDFVDVMDQLDSNTPLAPADSHDSHSLDNGSSRRSLFETNSSNYMEAPSWTRRPTLT
ncbi:MAG: flagellar biosynthetic protein FliO [Pirellulaceae bacterium]